MTDFVPPAAPLDVQALDEVAREVARGGVCVLTGAGMSTPSGIPDYRGPDGVRRVTPMEIAEFLRDPRGRRRYWARAAVGWQRFAAAQPNVAHRQVTELWNRGYVADVITQNVDGLHQRAGLTDVVELHGSLADVVCLDCGRRWGRAEVQADIETANPGHLSAGAAAALRPDGDVELAADVESRFVAPRCRGCGADTLKPDVVFFGESVPRERVDRCIAAVDPCRLLLVLGSSVSVMSSFRFVRQAWRAGTPVIVITRGVTRADGEQITKIDALVQDALGELLARL